MIKNIFYNEDFFRKYTVRELQQKRKTKKSIHSTFLDGLQQLVSRGLFRGVILEMVADVFAQKFFLPDFIRQFSVQFSWTTKSLNNWKLISYQFTSLFSFASAVLRRSRNILKRNYIADQYYPQWPILKLLTE